MEIAASTFMAGLLEAEDGGCKFLQNDGNHQPHYRSHIPEHSDLHSRCCENLRYLNLAFLMFIL